MPPNFQKATSKKVKEVKFFERMGEEKGIDKDRVLSGMRPTGALHVGHLKAVLELWRELQDKNECFFLVADLHALTTDWEKSKDIPKNSREMVRDWISAGIDPKKSVMFRQSDVPEHAELFVYLSMITPLGLLERNPTYKEMKEEIGSEEKVGNLGFFSYPVLQTADIIIYRAKKVPVGKDQIPHIEIARDIVEKFNRIFGPVFPMPEPLLAPTPKILGMDGRKMSKSYNNHISLSEDLKEIERRIKIYMTDTARKTRKDPGEPSRCPLFTLHEVFTPDDVRAEVVQNCRTASFGCLDCKKILLDYLLPVIESFQKRRAEISDDFVEDVLREGAKKAREEAQKTMELVKEAVFGRK